MIRAAAICLALAGCGSGGPILGWRDPQVPIAAAQSFDPARFTGTWYEIASYPTPFQAGCTDTVARYEARPDGGLSVLNACNRDGARETIAGTARVTGPGRLAVRLDGVPFAAPYWVLWVDDDYRVAAIGVPSGRAGWILARDRELSASSLAAAQDAFARNGYDVSGLRRTLQNGRGDRAASAAPGPDRLGVR